MAESQIIFVETSYKTRIALLINEDDNVSAFKEKFSKEHALCFPDSGEITVSSLKVKWQDRYYHLSDSTILRKVFEDNCERFAFVDISSVEKTLDDPTLQIQDAEEKTKKRKMKISSSAKSSRKKLALVPNESKDIENVLSLGDEDKKTIDGLVHDVHVKDVNDEDQTLDEQDVEKGVTNASAAAADMVMIDQENDVEKVAADNLLPTDAEDEGFIDATCQSLPNSGGEKVTNTHVETIQIDDEKVENGKEANAVKPIKKTKSRKEKVVPLVDSTSPIAVVALTARNVKHGDGEKIVKKSNKKSKKKQSDEDIVEEAPVVSAE